MSHVLFLSVFFYLSQFVPGEYLQIIIIIPLYLNFVVSDYFHLVLIYNLCPNVQVLVII